MHDYLLFSFLLLAGLLLVYIAAYRGRVVIRHTNDRAEWEEIDAMLTLLDEMN